MASSETTPPTVPPHKTNKSRRFSLRKLARPSSMVSATPGAGHTNKPDTSPQSDPSSHDASGATTVYVELPSSSTAPVASNSASNSASALAQIAANPRYSFATSPSTSAPVARLAPSNSEDTMHISPLDRIGGQLGAQMDMLELLPQRIQVHKLNKDLCEQKAEIFDLERESSAAVVGLPQLEMDYTSLKLKYNEQLENFLEMEKAADAIATNTANLSPKEKLRARRAELAVVELKPALLRQAIELDELEILINDKTSKSAAAENKIKELRKRAEECQGAMANFEKEFKAYNMKFTPFVPAAGQTMGSMERFLETAAKVLLERLEQIELLQEAVAKYKKGGSIEDLDVNPDQHHLLRKTRATLMKELEELRAQNERLVPLFLVGCCIRTKRAEKFAETKGIRKSNGGLLADGASAAHDADAKGDATLRLGNDSEDGENGLFYQMYNFEPNFIWEHREFEMFIEMINMGVDMEEWAQMDNEVFHKNYNTVINAILPDFKISTDKELKENAELDRAYILMQRAYQKAAHDLRKQSSTGSGDSMDVSGARLE